MACEQQKGDVADALLGCGIAVGGTALASTTPLVVIGLLGSARAGWALGKALALLSNCLDAQGKQPQAQVLTETAEKINEELLRLEQFAADRGLALA